jgi:hypothetical protein
MAESAALMVDDVLPHEPIRQWVLSFPFQLRFLCASYPHIMGKVLGIVYRTLATHITKKAGYNKQTDGASGCGNIDPTIWLSADKTAGSDVEQPEAGSAGVKGRTPEVI